MLTLSIEEAPARLIQPMSEDQFFEFCQRNRDLRIERAANGEIVIMPPVGLSGSGANSDVSGQLWEWTRKTGRGRSFGTDAGYTLPNGAVRSPDASWISSERLATVSERDYQRFAHVCPEFVIEVLPRSDSLKETQEKMVEWIENGVLLGWLINPRKEQVFIYAPDIAAQLLQSPEQLRGTGPVDGFVLDMTMVRK
jgi:Uma2 family endonuclease